MDEDDDLPPLHPALAALTSAEAVALKRSPDAAEAWLKSKGFTKAPPRFFATVARLVNEAQDKQVDAEAARHAAARKSPANRRRRDLARLRHLFDQVGRYLPQRMREVAFLCLYEGFSIAETARRLDIAPTSVRTHIKRLRAMERRNWEACEANRRAASRARA